MDPKGDQLTQVWVGARKPERQAIEGVKLSNRKLKKLAVALARQQAQACAQARQQASERPEAKASTVSAWQKPSGIDEGFANKGMYQGSDPATVSRLPAKVRNELQRKLRT